MHRYLRSIVRAAYTALLCTGFAIPALAQEEAPQPPDSTEAKTEAYLNVIGGEFTPGSGWNIIRTERGSLNISVYGLARYINQLPGEQTYTDHLGRERVVKARHDLNWHRTFVWLSGFFYEPKFRYNISVWSLPTTQQTLAYGALRYVASRSATVGVGIGPNLGTRSMQGAWPFMSGTDRQMADDFIRPGFTSSFFVTGEPVDGLFYNAVIGNNLSQLGVSAANDTRDLSYSGSVWWMPTTGEFGPRGGFGDFEEHQQVATRFGASTVYARDGRYSDVNSSGPNNTAYRFSDGVLVFDNNALADTVTLEQADYNLMTFDAGAKYKGFSVQAEVGIRKLSRFRGNNPLSIESVIDRSYGVQVMQMVMPKRLALYAAYGSVNDEFERNPWEVAGGASLYPTGTRSWRVNLHVIRIEKSPAGSLFGYYTAGQSGTTISLSTDVLL